jgi:pimeloyl-ACP methyl ester carboxylesterase
MDALIGPGLAPLPAIAAPPPDPDAQPAGFLVQVDGAVRIHFLDWEGDGRFRQAPRATRVLAIHGLAQTAATWAPVARRLRHDVRFVAMDLRGHGLSDAPVGGYERDRLVDDALAVAEGSGLLAPGDESPAWPLVVAGIGYGAIVAAWTAQALGRRCAGLVLVDGGWEDLGATMDAGPDEWLAAIEEPPEVLASMTAWLADRAAFDPGSWDHDQEIAARAQVVETAAGRVKIAVHPHALRASVEAMSTYAPMAVLPDVVARVAVLVGRDDAGTRVVALRDVAARRASGGRAPILAAAFPGRGHNLLRYEPGTVAAAVLAVSS